MHAYKQKYTFKASPNGKREKKPKKEKKTNERKKTQQGLKEDSNATNQPPTTYQATNDNNLSKCHKKRQQLNAAK